MEYQMQQMMIPAGPTPYLIQTFKLSPPIALSLEEVATNAQNFTKPKTDKSAGDAIKELIASENRSAPYTDLKICSYLNSNGYSLTMRDVAMAREILGIKSSFERTQ